MQGHLFETARTANGRLVMWQEPELELSYGEVRSLELAEAHRRRDAAIMAAAAERDAWIGSLGWSR